MLAREGGVEKALEAVPFLHDETHAYIKTVSLLAKNPALGDVKNWQGMSSTSALGVTKNYTKSAITSAANSVFVAGQQATNTTVNSIVPDAAVDPAKWNATTTLMNNIGDAVVGPLNDEAFLANLNSQLAQFNIQVTAKSVSSPTKFASATGAITRAITGEECAETVVFPLSTFVFFALFFSPTFSDLFFSLSSLSKRAKTSLSPGVGLSATGVNFAPCLISIAPTGVAVGGQGINISPVGVGIAPIGGSIAAQGVNLQPVLILVQPIGGNVQPQGAQIAPFLIAVSPIGGNVQPQGAVIAPVGTAIAPVGRAIVPQGAVIAPVHNAYAPVRVNLTPPKA